MFIHCKLAILILVLSLDSQVHTGKIIGGHEAVPHSRPYMVLLKQHTTDGKPKYCGGFLLNEDFVMSAAHCQAERIAVYIGAHRSPIENIQPIPVKQTFPHKAFNATSYKNDIMLLKLSSKAHFNKNVRPIALGDHSGLPKACIVSGWGRDNASEYMSVVLKEVNVTLIDDIRCSMENNYCSKGETGPAEGDSGGPLVCEDGKAYGVVSNSLKPHSGAPPIHFYSKISHYKSWVTSTIRNAWKSSKYITLDLD